MDKKTWIQPEVKELSIKNTEKGNAISGKPDASYSDGTFTWYSYPS